MNKLIANLTPYQYVIENDGELLKMLESLKLETKGSVLRQVTRFVTAVEEESNKLAVLPKALFSEDVQSEPKLGLLLYQAEKLDVKSLVAFNIIKNECEKVTLNLDKAIKMIKRIKTLLKDYSPEVEAAAKKINDGLYERMVIANTMHISVSEKRDLYVSELIEKANAEAKKVTEWLEENRIIFQPKELKLQDAYDYCEQNGMPDKYYAFAEATFEAYLKALKKRDALAQFYPNPENTDTFYLYDPDPAVSGIVLNFWGTPDADKCLQGLTRRFGYSELGLKFEDGEITSGGLEFTNEDLLTLAYVASGAFTREVIAVLGKILLASRLIADLKKDQMDFLYEYLSYESPADFSSALTDYGAALAAG